MSTVIITMMRFIIIQVDHLAMAMVCRAVIRTGGPNEPSSSSPFGYFHNHPIEEHFFRMILRMMIQRRIQTIILQAQQHCHHYHFHPTIKCDDDE
jgi:hypothetical protein